LFQGLGIIAGRPRAGRAGLYSMSIGPARACRPGSRIGITASAATTNEIAISQKTIGSPAWSPRTSMIPP